MLAGAAAEQTEYEALKPLATPTLHSVDIITQFGAPNKVSSAAEVVVSKDSNMLQRW